MDASLLIAQLIGPVLMVLSLTEFLNYHIWAKVEPTVVYLNGILLFLGGLAIIRSHNHWHLDWTILITLIGWLALMLGLYRSFFPSAPQAPKNIVTTISLCVLFIAGAFLTFKAYI